MTDKAQELPSNVPLATLVGFPTPTDVLTVYRRLAAQKRELRMATTLVKTTQDGRRLEVVGLAICLAGQLEAFELIEVKLHPNRRAILKVMPEATHMAGRVALSRAEADIVTGALKQAETEILASPAAINERFRIAAMWKAREQGIE